jgi:hypothetical protein
VSDDVGPAIERDDPHALHRALDFFVFAPVGLVLTVAEDLPNVIAKGRQRVESEISNARVVGKFFVAQSQREIAQRLNALWGRGTPEAPTAPHQPERTAAQAPEAPPATPKPAPDPAAEAIVHAALADYDTLSASQVVRRLESLGPDELRAVHRHEASHRNRRTILNRATQLLDEMPASTSTE